MDVGLHGRGSHPTDQGTEEFCILNQTFFYPHSTILEHYIVHAKITTTDWGNDIIPDNKFVKTR